MRRNLHLCYTKIIFHIILFFLEAFCLLFHSFIFMQYIACWGPSVLTNELNGLVSTLSSSFLNHLIYVFKTSSPSLLFLKASRLLFLCIHPQDLLFKYCCSLFSTLIQVFRSLIWFSPFVLFSCMIHLFIFRSHYPRICEQWHNCLS